MFSVSPIPACFQDLYAYLFKKAARYNVIDFNIEIRAGKEFVEVIDDESYALVKEMST